MQLKDPFLRSRYYLYILWAIAIFLMGLGIFLSKINYLDTEWFSRSGCTIVILGIWSGLGVIIQERLLAVRLRWRRRNALSQIRAELEPAQPLTSNETREIEHIQHALDKHEATQTQKLKLSFGIVEVSLLITGTFIWGFGDLLMQ